MLGEKSAHLTIKVPQESFSAFIEEVSMVGEVVGKSISETDVTDKIIDLRARIRNAEAVEASLLELLEKTRTLVRCSGL